MSHIRKTRNSKGELKWRAEVRIIGVGKRSKTFNRKTDANAWARTEEEKMQRFGADIEKNENHTLEEAIERYLTEHLPTLKDQTTVKGVLTWWQKKLGARFINSITPQELIKLRHHLTNEPISNKDQANPNPRFRKPRTVQGYMSALAHLYSLAMREWGWVAKNPLKQVKKVKINNARSRFLSDPYYLWPNEDDPRHWDKLTDDEKLLAAQQFPRAYELPRLVQALKSQADKGSSFHSNSMWAYYLFTIQLSAGLRLAEATHMVWEENDLISHPIVIVDMAKKVLTLKSTKHDPTPRTKPIGGAMFDVLKELYANRRYDTPLVFPRKDGQKPLEFRKRIACAIADAGLQDFRWHDLRHTTASYLAMMGANQPELMKALHHKNLQSSQRYTHLSNNHMRGLMDRFSETVLETSQSPSRF